MSDKTITRFIGEAKDSLNQIANDSMRFPKSEPFEHGVQVGKYQGLLFALEILEEILRDNFDKESKS